MGDALWLGCHPKNGRAIEGFVSVAGIFEKKELGLNDIEILPTEPVPEEEIIHEAHKRIGLLKVIVGLARQLRPLGVKVKPKPKNPVTDEDENLTTAELEALRAALEQQLSSSPAPKAPTVSRQRRKATASNG